MITDRHKKYRFFFLNAAILSVSVRTYKEIFFITMLEKDAKKWVYIPLKMLLLVSQLYMFDGVLQRYYHHLKVGSPREELSLFAHYLYYLGIKGIYISATASEFEVICGKYGVIITNQKSLIVRDYGDYFLPESAIPFTSKDEGAFFDDTFEKNINEFVHDNTFVCGFVFDVNK